MDKNLLLKGQKNLASIMLYIRARNMTNWFYGYTLKNPVLEQVTLTIELYLFLTWECIKIIMRLIQT
jgi:hypothetical protein